MQYQFLSLRQVSVLPSSPFSNYAVTGLCDYDAMFPCSDATVIAQLIRSITAKAGEGDYCLLPLFPSLSHPEPCHFYCKSVATVSNLLSLHSIMIFLGNFVM